MQRRNKIGLKRCVAVTNPIKYLIFLPRRNKMQTKCCVAIGLCLVHDTLTKKCHIFRQGVISFLKSERFTVDLDEKLGDSLLECPGYIPLEQIWSKSIKIALLVI